MVELGSKPATLSDGAAQTPPEPAALEPPPLRVRVELPVVMILKVIAVIVALFIVQSLTVVIIQIFVALLITAAFEPLVTRLQRHRVPRSLTVALLILAFLGLIALVVYIFVPPLISQAQQIAHNLPSYVEEGRRVLKHYPSLYSRINEAATRGSANPNAIVNQALTFGTSLISIGTNVILTITLAAYLLIDGEHIFNGIAGFIPVRHRLRVRRVFPEVSRVVRGYLVGQSINSTLAGTYYYIVLAVLDVPQALLLALLAAIADAIPIFGPFIATVPPVLIAATISIPKAIAVLVLYLIYQQIEAGYIVPRVLGSRLRISSFAVLVAILIGVQLLGIIGAFLALPIAAALPTVAKIWRETEETAQPAAGPTPEQPASTPTPAAR